MRCRPVHGVALSRASAVRAGHDVAASTPRANPPVRRPVRPGGTCRHRRPTDHPPSVELESLPAIASDAAACRTGGERHRAGDRGRGEPGQSPFFSDTPQVRVLRPIGLAAQRSSGAEGSCGRGDTCGSCRQRRFAGQCCVAGASRRDPALARRVGRRRRVSRDPARRPPCEHRGSVAEHAGDWCWGFGAFASPGPQQRSGPTCR